MRELVGNEEGTPLQKSFSLSKDELISVSIDVDWGGNKDKIPEIRYLSHPSLVDTRGP
jgi:hypothetical protein